MSAARAYGRLTLALLCFLSLLFSLNAFTKVVVPSVYREWDKGKPHWATDPEIQKKHNFTVFLYQKFHPDVPNYFAFNRGSETGVYLKYIVDHYDNFPDVAIFVHAKPHDHQPNWLHMVGCISPNATWYNINNSPAHWIVREPSIFDLWTVPGVSIAMEQCWRDVLKILWGYKGRDEDFNKLLPGSEPIKMKTSCCNQFLMSRATVHKRPLQVWKDLLHIIAEQPLCHMGEPDYEHLYEYKRLGTKIPEQLWYNYGDTRESSANRNGYLVPGTTGEHLSHVIFGHKELLSSPPTQEEVCQNFIEGCLSSPCKGSGLSQATTVVQTLLPSRAAWFMVLYKGKRHNIPDMDTLDGLDVPGESILLMDLEDVKMYPEGPPLTPCDKTWVPNVCKDSFYYKALHGSAGLE